MENPEWLNCFHEEQELEVIRQKIHNRIPHECQKHPENPNFIIVNEFHSYCTLCGDHLYTKADPNNVNSFFEKHTNSPQHKYKLRYFDVSLPLFGWSAEHQNASWVCNVCNYGVLPETFSGDKEMKEIMANHEASPRHKWYEYINKTRYMTFLWYVTTRPQVRELCHVDCLICDIPLWETEDYHLRTQIHLQMLRQALKTIFNFSITDVNNDEIVKKLLEELKTKQVTKLKKVCVIPKSQDVEKSKKKGKVKAEIKEVGLQPTPGSSKTSVMEVQTPENQVGNKNATPRSSKSNYYNKDKYKKKEKVKAEINEGDDLLSIPGSSKTPEKQIGKLETPQSSKSNVDKSKKKGKVKEDDLQPTPGSPKTSVIEVQTPEKQVGKLETPRSSKSNYIKKDKYKKKEKIKAEINVDDDLLSIPGSSKTPEKPVGKLETPRNSKSKKKEKVKGELLEDDYLQPIPGSSKTSIIKAQTPEKQVGKQETPRSSKSNVDKYKKKEKVKTELKEHDYLPPTPGSSKTSIIKAQTPEKQVGKLVTTPRSSKFNVVKDVFKPKTVIQLSESPVMKANTSYGPSPRNVNATVPLPAVTRNKEPSANESKENLKSKRRTRCRRKRNPVVEEPLPRAENKEVRNANANIPVPEGVKNAVAKGTPVPKVENKKENKPTRKEAKKQNIYENENSSATAKMSNTKLFYITEESRTTVKIIGFLPQTKTKTFVFFDLENAKFTATGDYAGACITFEGQVKEPPKDDETDPKDAGACLTSEEPPKEDENTVVTKMSNTELFYTIEELRTAIKVKGFLPQTKTKTFVYFDLENAKFTATAGDAGACITCEGQLKETHKDVETDPRDDDEGQIKEPPKEDEADPKDDAGACLTCERQVQDAPKDDETDPKHAGDCLTSEGQVEEPTKEDEKVPKDTRACLTCECQVNEQPKDVEIDPKDGAKACLTCERQVKDAPKDDETDPKHAGDCLTSEGQVEEPTKEDEKVPKDARACLTCECQVKEQPKDVETDPKDARAGLTCEGQVEETTKEDEKVPEDDARACLTCECQVKEQPKDVETDPKDGARAGLTCGDLVEEPPKEDEKVPKDDAGAALPCEGQVKEPPKDDETDPKDDAGTCLTCEGQVKDAPKDDETGWSSGL